MSNKIAVVLSVAGTALLATQLPAQSAPLMAQPLMAKSAAANANTLEVRFGGWRGGWGAGGAVAVGADGAVAGVAEGEVGAGAWVQLPPEP